MKKTRGRCRNISLRSKDGGKSWTDKGDLEIIDKSRNGSDIYLYSPMQRSDAGTVRMTGYEADLSEGDSNAARKDRSVLYISRDDGYTWEAPVYFDENNFDCNECMVADTGGGDSVAFMRTLRAKNMWMSTSADGGMTWTPLKQTDVTGECPFIIKHSSGALVFFSRGYGSFIKISHDKGRSWSPEYRILPASAMAGMAEIYDGRIIILMHEGFRVPSKVRGQFFKVTNEGPVPA
jgi:hypothetical protein